MIHSVTSLRRSSDCTRGGITTRFDNLLMADLQDEAQKHVEAQPGDAQRMLVVCERRGYKFATPLHALTSGTWTMMGGNFVYTSNGSFTDKYPSPIPVHDRIERSDN